MSAHANEGDVIHTSASFLAMRDDNLFRLAPGASPSRTRGDTIGNTEIGVNVDKRLSMQRLLANLSWTDTRYQQYDYLNFRALNYDAQWLWRAGLRWSGELFLNRTQSLVSFADYRNVAQRNVRVIEDKRFNLDYWLHSDWHAVGGVSYHELTNEQNFLEESDYDLSGWNLGFRYRPRSENALTWRVRREEGNYRKRQFSAFSQFDNAFTQTGQELQLNWQLTGKSAVSGSLGHVNRRHEHFGVRDFSGWVGNVDYVHGYHGHTTLNIGYRHDLTAYQQLSSSYYVADEVNSAVQWSPTNKVTATARLGYGRRKYLGEVIALPAAIPQRQDETAQMAIEGSYKPARWAEVKTGFAQERRFSNQNALDYVDRRVFLSFTATF